VAWLQRGRRHNYAMAALMPGTAGEGWWHGGELATARSSTGGDARRIRAARGLVARAQGGNGTVVRSGERRAAREAWWWRRRGVATELGGVAKRRARVQERRGVRQLKKRKNRSKTKGYMGAQIRS
jgi:hypothetical protein